MNDDLAPEPEFPTTASRRAAPSPWALRYRVLKRRGWTASFRLEQAFWDVLEEAARSGGLKLADFIRESSERLIGEANNHSSALRVQALEFLDRRRRALEKLADLDNVAGAALAAPAPCFVLNSARRLVTHNREFQDLVANAARNVSGANGASAHLTLDAPVPKLIEALESKSHAALVCGYAIHVQTNANVLRGRARVTLVRTREHPLLVGYILDVRA